MFERSWYIDYNELKLSLKKKKIECHMVSLKLKQELHRAESGPGLLEKDLVILTS